MKQFYREFYRELAKDVYYRRAKAGICTQCGKAPAAPNVRKCHSCAAKHSMYAMTHIYRKAGQPEKAMAVKVRYYDEVRLGRH